MFRNPQSNITNNIAKYIKKIKKLIYFYIMIIIFKLLFGDINLLMDIFMLFILYLMFTNINFQFIAWCIISLIMTGFSVLIILLYFLQNIYLGFYIRAPIITIYMLVLISQLILFILLINNSFQLYKESRIIYRSLVGYRNNRELANLEQHRRPTLFSGSGQVVGGN